MNLAVCSDPPPVVVSIGRRADGEWKDTAVWPATSPAENLRQGELAQRLAREIGWRAGEAYAMNSLAVYLAPRGEYGQALELARAGAYLSFGSPLNWPGLAVTWFTASSSTSAASRFG